MLWKLVHADLTQLGSFYLASIFSLHAVSSFALLDLYVASRQTETQLKAVRCRSVGRSAIERPDR
jgi:hypothetical protein